MWNKTIMDFYYDVDRVYNAKIHSKERLGLFDYICVKPGVLISPRVNIEKPKDGSKTFKYILTLLDKEKAELLNEYYTVKVSLKATGDSFGKTPKEVEDFIEIIIEELIENHESLLILGLKEYNKVKNNLNIEDLRKEAKEKYENKVKLRWGRVKRVEEDLEELVCEEPLCSHIIPGFIMEDDDDDDDDFYFDEELFDEDED